jgi:hypothetical protein
MLSQILICRRPVGPIQVTHVTTTRFAKVGRRPPLCHPACPGAPWSAPWDLRKNSLNVGHGYEDFRVFPQLAGHFMVVQRLTSLPFSNRIDVEEVMAESETGPNSSDLLRITNSRYTCS